MLTLDLRRIDPETPEGVARLGEVLDALETGAVVAFPTDTVWGLGTCSQDPAQIDRLFQLKGRDPGKPVSYLIPSLDALEPLFEDEVPPALLRAGRQHWPGATTLIVEADPRILPAGRRGAPGLGLRIPDHAMLRRVLTGLPPLAQTSANRSGEPPLGDAAAVAAAFGEGLDVLLLLEPPPRGGASQVLMLDSQGGARVLRPGGPAHA